MANKKFMAGILVMVLVFGIIIAGCELASTADPALNGTWDRGTQVLTLNNGNFELKAGGTSVFKGTYTTSGTSVTFKITYYWGESISLDSKWYSRNDLKTAGLADSQLDDLFASYQGTVNGTRLTLTTGDVFTKRG